MPKIEIGDAQLYYELHGERRDGSAPLVLIPGFGTGSWIWYKQIPAFAREFCTIVLDPRGVARSTAPDESFSINTLANDVAALLRSIEIEKAHILGASFGGFIAQEFALADPQMTGSLVLSCTSSGGAGHVPAPASTLAAIASTKKLNTEERVRENLLLAFSPEFIEEQPEQVEEVIHLRAANPVPEYIYLHQLQAAMRFDTAARIAAIEAPTLVITGDADMIVPAENSRNLANSLPGSELVIIEGGSHTFFIERPEEFNAAVINFLKRV